MVTALEAAAADPRARGHVSAKTLSPHEGFRVTPLRWREGTKKAGAQERGAWSVTINHSVLSLVVRQRYSSMSSSREVDDFFSWLQNEFKHECDEDGGELWIDILYMDEERDGSEPPLVRIQDFFDSVSVKQTNVIITKLASLMEREIRSTIDFIVRAFGTGNGGAMQSRLRDISSVSEHMVGFMSTHVMVPLLESDKWAGSRDTTLQKCCYNVLLLIQTGCV